MSTLSLRSGFDSFIATDFHQLSSERDAAVDLFDGKILPKAHFFGEDLYLAAVAEKFEMIFQAQSAYEVAEANAYRLKEGLRQAVQNGDLPIEHFIEFNTEATDLLAEIHSLIHETDAGLQDTVFAPVLTGFLSFADGISHKIMTKFQQSLTGIDSELGSLGDLAVNRQGEVSVVKALAISKVFSVTAAADATVTLSRVVDMVKDGGQLIKTLLTLSSAPSLADAQKALDLAADLASSIIDEIKGITESFGVEWDTINSASTIAKLASSITDLIENAQEIIGFREIVINGELSPLSSEMGQSASLNSAIGLIENIKTTLSEVVSSFVKIDDSNDPMSASNLLGSVDILFDGAIDIFEGAIRGRWDGEHSMANTILEGEGGRGLIEMVEEYAALIGDQLNVLDDISGGTWGEDQLPIQVYEAATVGARVLRGGSGNDHISTSDAFEFVAGGEGTDTATFSGSLEDYKIALGADSSIRVGVIDANQADRLFDVEFMKFDDVTLSTSDVAAGLAFETRQDDQNNESWITYTEGRDADENLKVRIITFDDGRVQTNRYEAGSLTTSAMADLGGVHDWSEYTFTYVNGEKASRTMSYDDGRQKVETYENGVLASLHFEDLGDSRNWMSYQDTFDFSGQLTHRSMVFDNGRTHVSEYSDGEIFRLTVDDTQDNYSWTSRVESYEDDVLVSTHTYYDDGTDTLIFA